jgi:Peptidase family M23
MLAAVTLFFNWNTTAPESKHIQSLSLEPRDSIHRPADSLSTDMSDYIWPTSAPHVITSSFADFRSSHFHEGIDISTQRRVGAKVFASRDGYVDHISVSPYGYGRYLVLRHNDGYYTAYAHLGWFNRTLDSLVHAEQEKTGKFSVELEFQPNQIPVHKGEVIAYSGESGVGGPHLHFEIRDRNFNPVNPLLFPNIGDMHDSKPPTFQRLAVTPLDDSSFIDGKFDTKLYHVYRKSDKRFVEPNTIHASGAIGFSVDASDPGNRTWYRTSVYSLELKIDNKTFFTCKHDRFPDDEAREIGLDYDFQLYKERRGQFQKLYIDDGNTLPFYGGENISDGFVSLKDVSEGKHTFSIVATDCAGNTSELDGAFVINHPPTVTIDGITGHLLEVHVPDFTKISAVEISSKRFSQNKWKSYEYKNSQLASSAGSLLVPLPHNDGNVLRIIAENTWGSKSFPVFYFIKAPRSSSAIKISKRIEANDLKLRIESNEPFTSPPIVDVRQGTNEIFVPLRPLDMNLYEGACNLPPSFNGMLYIEASCGAGETKESAGDSIKVASIIPESGGNLVSDDGDFSLTFNKNSCFMPVHFTVTEHEGKYAVEPADMLLHAGISASMRYPESDPEPTLRMYVNYGSGWRMLSSDIDTETHSIVVHDTHSLGRFALFTDTKSPVIRYWKASHYNVPHQPLFSFSVRDNFSGVDPDQINIFMNDKRVIAEYDPERRLVFYVPFDPVPRGHYSVSIEVKDRVGNTTRRTESLTIFR